jgi:hypothetical protein
LRLLCIILMSRKLSHSEKRLLRCTTRFAGKLMWIQIINRGIEGIAPSFKPLEELVARIDGRRVVIEKA